MQGLNIHGTHSFSMCSYVYILLTTRPGLQPLPEITVTKSVHVLLLEGHVVLRLTYASAGGRMVETASFLYSQECVEGLLPQTCSHHTFQETMQQRGNVCFHKLEKLMGEDLKRQFPNDLTYKSCKYIPESIQIRILFPCKTDNFGRGQTKILDFVFNCCSRLGAASQAALFFQTPRALFVERGPLCECHVPGLFPTGVKC